MDEVVGGCRLRAITNTGRKRSAVEGVRVTVAIAAVTIDAPARATPAGKPTEGWR